MSASDLPRPFGDYLLTASLGEDALGRVYRAVRMAGEKTFVRLRILESPELSEDAILDAIQEYGEIHTFLKNPAIARGVQMDAVDGTPFIAWNEESGRTLDALLEKARTTGQRVPPEHALLIAEKAASALDHAYNTTVDGERTVHGLVWPGFVCITDDGETRLAGFGLAPGILPSLDRPRVSAEIAPYVAPEVRASRKIGRNSDVFSVGVLLYELLSGQLPSGDDSLEDLRTLARDEEGGTLTPEVIALLRTALAPADSRYQSPVELRRELGKLLFSGPYAPSTFNLAFFLSHAFGSEIEAEADARKDELRREPLAAGNKGPPPAHAAKPQGSGSARERPVPAPARVPSPPAPRGEKGPQGKRPVAVVVAALLVAAVVGALYVLTRAPEGPAAVRLSRSAVVETPAFTPTALPTPEIAAPTVQMTDAQFKDEVSRRVTEEIRRLEENLNKKEEKARAARASAEPVAPAVSLEPRAEEPTPAPAVVAAAEPAPSPSPEPVRPGVREAGPSAATPGGEAATATSEEPLLPPRIKRVVKPNYPPMALRQRIGGIVILKVLVSETGQPLEVEVARGVRGGLSEAAAAAVRRWTFEPATRNGEPVPAWTTVPIPFEP